MISLWNLHPSGNADLITSKNFPVPYKTVHEYTETLSSDASVSFNKDDRIALSFRWDSIATGTIKIKYMTVRVKTAVLPALRIAQLGQSPNSAH